MKLSIIIVNYNVKSFLEQCLYSVYKALQGIDGEVIVVDNDSLDNSVLMVRNTFPSAKIIVNEENMGFSKANNTGIKNSLGEYILFLNPDTVIEENTLHVCLNFMESHPDAGALGPKMIDGKGNFLPESKRGLPKPLTAFLKISGINKLFPKSRFFNRYYLGHLCENETQRVDVLTGAFFFTKREVLNKAGLFDESFFMYGEDVDLSYRINKAGYNNYYYPETTIIHYKGESTKRSSINYVLVFYKAMEIFTNKHFRKQNAWWFTLLIKLAIYLRAFVSVLYRLFLKTFPILLDTMLIYFGLYIIANFWEEFYFHKTNYYDNKIYYYIFPIYTVIWVSSLLFLKSYKSPYKLINTAKGIFIGSVILLIFYALLPESMRFSRALILFGSFSTFCIAIFTKFLLHLTGISYYRLYSRKHKKIAILGKYNEIQRVENLLLHVGITKEQIDYVFPSESEMPEPYYYNMSNIKKVIKNKNITEIIFCALDMPSEEIIKQMKILTQANIDFKIATPGSNNVIGSNSSKTSGDIYSIKINSSDSSN